MSDDPSPKVRKPRKSDLGKNSKPKDKVTMPHAEPVGKFEVILSPAPNGSYTSFLYDDFDQAVATFQNHANSEVAPTYALMFDHDDLNGRSLSQYPCSDTKH